MSQLLACPFCRELFHRGEASRCPDCDLILEPVHRLPPSREVAEEEAARREQTPPEHEPLPARHLGRGRGALLALALASLCSFWLLPWVEITAPHRAVRSGYSLASGPLGFLWGGAVAWFVCLALTASRRTIAQMRGVRAILTLFAAMTASEVLVLLLMSPTGSRHVPVAYQWRAGLYASLALSLAGMVVATRFGGSLPRRQQDATVRPSSAADPASDSAGSGAGGSDTDGTNADGSAPPGAMRTLH